MSKELTQERWGVHRTHCCFNHGCKYGDEDCPVELGLIKQELKDEKKCTISSVVFSVSDKVYMDSLFGRYTGEVKKVGDKKMTIESHSPTGNGCTWAEYDIDGTDWKKY